MKAFGQTGKDLLKMMLGLSKSVPGKEGTEISPCKSTWILKSGHIENQNIKKKVRNVKHIRLWGDYIPRFGELELK